MNLIPYIILLIIGIIYLDFAAWYSARIDELMDLDDTAQNDHKPRHLLSQLWDRLLSWI